MSITIRIPGEFDAGVEFTNYAASETLVVTPEVQRAAVDAGIRILTESEYQQHLLDNFERGKWQKEESLRAFLREYLIREDQFDLCVDLFSELGWPEPTRKWLVTVEIDCQLVLSVIVDADDEDDAVRMVENELSTHTAYVTVNYSGPGEVEDANDYEIDTDYLLDGTSDMSITAEPYEE